MKVNLTVELSDEALIGIGIGRHGTLTRATRLEARDWALGVLQTAAGVREGIIEGIAKEVINKLGDVAVLTAPASGDKAEAL